MTVTHIAIVFNPAKTSRDDIDEVLRVELEERPQVQVSWFETEVEDPGLGMTREAVEAGCDLVVAAGGDGTVRAVAHALAEDGAEAALCIVPLGTGNLLARNLGVPLNDIRAALAAAWEGEERAIDLAWAEASLDGATERHAFTVMAGVGIDAHMITETDEDLKDKVGWLAYVESLGRAVSESDVIDMTVAVDGGEAVGREAHTLIVGNCGILTGGVTLLPDADPSDGELDMLVLSADGVPGWLDTLRSMVWDNGLKRLVLSQDQAASTDTVEHRRVTTVELTVGEPRPLELDGEDVGECTSVEFSIQAGAVRVRTPRSA